MNRVLWTRYWLECRRGRRRQLSSLSPCRRLKFSVSYCRTFGGNLLFSCPRIELILNLIINLTKKCWVGSIAVCRRSLRYSSFTYEK